MNAETELLETRIFSETLNSGDMFDLVPEDFSVEHYRAMWAIMLQLHAEHGSVDYVILGEKMARSGLDQRAYLKTLATEERLSRPEIIPAYANQLRLLSRSTSLKRKLNDLASSHEPPDTVIANALMTLKGMSGTLGNKAQTIKSVLTDVISDMDARCSSHELPGITTGFPTLDELTGGWQKGDLNLIAARPAAGKTAIMVRMALAATHIGKKPAIISAEQPARQIVQRMIAIEGRLPAWKLRNPYRLSEDEWTRMTKITMELSKLQCEILDKSSPRADQLANSVAGIDADIVFVDYVQRLKAKGEGVYDRVSAVAAALKEMARDLDIPVVALCQINRAGDGKSSMIHLKGSGDLEQEADTVAILTRNDEAGTASLTLDKNRHGPVGTLDMVFMAECMRFEELAKREGVA